MYYKVLNNERIGGERERERERERKKERGEKEGGEGGERERDSHMLLTVILEGTVSVTSLLLMATSMSE